ncbi:AbgT family transporter [Xenorhabdus sp. M]|uniref:AbgT family transporter n=1 Tax=Xenorhabdus szentirmaii TaxID=290112 RepID=A0AAW3Z0Q0_9GAMM|nr:AbgT family transporter [Xenorhabdus sp. M]
MKTPLGAILARVCGLGIAEKVVILQCITYKMASGIHKRHASYIVLLIVFFSHIHGYFMRFGSCY